MSCVRLRLHRCAVALLTLAAVLLLLPASARAGGPRWVTGPPFFFTEGVPVPFFTETPLYFTDPGPLNAHVTHAQADAMVAAAAATWNVPYASLILAQGGTLAEHLSSANVYFNGTDLSLPDDVRPANYRSKPIAVIYDTDGSVIDTLLGSGASDPAGCRQTGVVESVDGLDPDGTIHHALLILNGRCVGTNPDQLTQMQYQLMRAFGRVLGLAWSQLNDNIFTGASPTTALEMQYWPVMHPIDVVCGTYTYKCMPQPFTLRPDDISALSLLYPVRTTDPTLGKISTQSSGASNYGWVRFPTGQGMDSANVTVQRILGGEIPEKAVIVSAVTGILHHQFLPNPVLGNPVTLAQSAGGSRDDLAGEFYMQRIPISASRGWDSLLYTAESINPLYTGDYSIAPYIGEAASVSGPNVTLYDGLATSNRTDATVATAQLAAAVCNPGNDGTESAPVAADPSGWWPGQLCADRHSSWFTHTARAGHTWTVEVTALDDSSSPSTAKAHPLLGAWAAADPLGTTPTVAFTPAPFNAAAVGTTSMRMSATSADATFRLTITDERGHGRPDFNYKARLLYADTVAPAQVGGSGGQITITGLGFRSGNRVLVNGVAARVMSTTANTLVAMAPTRSAAKMTATGSADITVLDPQTGGATTIQGALSYAGTAVNVILLESSPATGETGFPAGTPFAIRVLQSDGVTPVPGAAVQITAAGPALSLSGCPAVPCTLLTDAAGRLQTTLTPLAAGTLTLTATELSGGATVQATVQISDPVRSLAVTTPPVWLAAGAPATWPVSIAALQDGAPAASLTVSFSPSSGLGVSPPTSTTDAQGLASITASTTGLSAGAQGTVTACAWTSICAQALAYAVGPASWQVGVSAGSGQSVQASLHLAPVSLRVTDGVGHPLQGATVTVLQTVDAWEGPCNPASRCPAAPVLASSRLTAISDAAGLVSVQPLEIPGIASTVNIAAITGTQGFVSLSLLKTP